MRKLALFSFVVALALFLFPQQTQAYTNGMSASVVVGQANFNSAGVNGGGANSSGLNSPSGTFSDGTRLFVSDCSNNRVLIFNSIPISNGATADVVVGQADMTSGLANRGQSLPSANTLSCPQGIYSNGTNLIITDGSNHRILIFNTIPTANGASADVVVGQADMVSKSANRGGSASANTFNNPRGVFVETTSGKMFVADLSNHRVLIFNSVPTTNGAAADLVLGQADMTSTSANRGGSVAGNTLSYPVAVIVASSKLIISDYFNHRVLVWNTVPTSSGVSADVAVGQSNLTSNSSGTTDSKLYYPQGIAFDGTYLIVGDYYNHRLMLFSGVPTASGTAATAQLGQANFTSRNANYSGSTTPVANGFQYPTGVSAASSKLFVVDGSNYRVLVFENYPATTSASVAVGQSSFTNKLVNNTAVNSRGLNYPRGVYSDGTRLFIADGGNNRVLIYNTIPTTINAAADVVIGQTDMSGFLANQGGSAAANTLSNPWNVYSDGTKLFVADAGNNRLLIFNSIPTTSNASADVVLGQPDMTTTTAVTSQTGLWGVAGVFYDKDTGKLLALDEHNNRALIWNAVPTTNGAPADVVLGKANFTSRSCGVSQSNLCPHGEAIIADGKVIVSDTSYSRYMVWNSIPTTNGVLADAVIGQQNFTSSSVNQGLGATNAGANTLGAAYGASWDGKRLFVVDFSNARVLGFYGVPTANNASADLVIGQPDFTSESANRGLSIPDSNTLTYPIGVFASPSKLFVSDYGNHRVLVFNDEVVSPKSNVSGGGMSGIDGGMLRYLGVATADSPYTVRNVEYSVNDGGWNGASAKDGAFNSGLEEYSFDFDPKSSGNSEEGYTLKVKVTNSNADVNEGVFYFTPFTAKSPSGGANFLSSDEILFPMFNFTVNRQRRVMSKMLSKYQIRVKSGEEGEWKTYLDSIPVDPVGNSSGSSDIWEDENIYVKYSADRSEILVTAKKTNGSLKLFQDGGKVLSGKVFWKALAIDKSGNELMSDEAYFYAQANGFSGDLSLGAGTSSFVDGKFFPISILSISGADIGSEISTGNPGQVRGKYFANISSPTIYGIVPSSTSVRLNARNADSRCVRDCVFSFEARSGADSRFGINIPRGTLKTGQTYVFNFAAWNGNLSNQLPEFSLQIGGTQTEAKPKVLGSGVSKKESAEKPGKKEKVFVKPAPAAVPSKRNFCFLFWCF